MPGDSSVSEDLPQANADELLTEMSEVCDAGGELQEFVDGQAENAIGLEHIRLMGEIMIRACESPRTIEAIETFVAELDAVESRVCTLTTQNWDGRFSQLRDNVWTSVTEPSGELCGRTVVQTLEKYSREGSNLSWWKLTERRIYADDSEDCSDLDDFTEVYDEALYDRAHSISCGYIKPGRFWVTR